MTDLEIREQVFELVKQISTTELELNESLRLIDDIGLVSIMFIEMVVEIEVTFGIMVPDDFVVQQEIQNLGDLVRVITGLVRSAAS
jgi:acyl carrier protein